MQGRAGLCGLQKTLNSSDSESFALLPTPQSTSRSLLWPIFPKDSEAPLALQNIISGHSRISCQWELRGAPVAVSGTITGSQLPQVKDDSCRVFNVVRTAHDGKKRSTLRIRKAESGRPGNVISHVKAEGKPLRKFAIEAASQV